MSTTTITFRFRVNSALTSATSAKLSDPTGTYGVKRTDTDAVVVNDDTAMTEQSTGVYTYSFTDPAQGLEYNYYVEVVYSGTTYHFEKNISATAADAATTLDAVNEMLEALGEPPVDELDTDGTSDIAEAEAFLDRTRRRILTRGWNCNTIEQDFTRDGNDQIPLTDVLRIDTTEDYAIRDGYLYDLDNATLTFTDDVDDLDVVKLITLAQCPEMLRALIIAKAAVDFQRYKKRGQIDDALARDKLLDAKIAAEQEDEDLRQGSMLTTTEAKDLKGDR
jgi:hypothetical protein